MSKSIMLLGRPLTFGDVEQIKELKRIIADAEHREHIEKYGCKECDAKGTIEEECFECGGAGYIEEDCKKCDGKGIIEP